jgi:two-component system, OmpR family, response regulator
VTRHIMVVDDDPHIREVICVALSKAGLSPIIAKNGTEALSRFAAEQPVLVILDIGMPEIDGLEVCRQIRKSSDVPILFLSARDEEIDRVLGLEIGGDDYITKPFSPRELVARVNVRLRRAAAHSVAASSEATGDIARPLSHGDLIIDPAAHLARLGNEDITLTALEFDIMKTMLGRPSLVFTRDQIMAAAYRSNTQVSDRTIDSHIRNIRSKFATKGCDSAIETVHGVGFRLGRCELH